MNPLENMTAKIKDYNYSGTEHRTPYFAKSLYIYDPFCAFAVTCYRRRGRSHIFSLCVQLRCALSALGSQTQKTVPGRGDSLGWGGGRQLPLPHHGQLWMTVEHLKPSVFKAGAVSAFCSLEQTSRSRLESLHHHAKTSGRGQGARERTLKTSMNRGNVGCLREEASGGTGGPGNSGCQCALTD